MLSIHGVRCALDRLLLAVRNFSRICILSRLFRWGLADSLRFSLLAFAPDMLDFLYVFAAVPVTPAVSFPQMKTMAPGTLDDMVRPRSFPRSFCMMLLPFSRFSL